MTSSQLVLPRRSDELDIFAKQLCNIAKVLQEDQETGSREYRYRKLGEDHYRHTLNYFYLASTKTGIAESKEAAFMRHLAELSEAANPYDPFTFKFGGNGYDPWKWRQGK